MTEVEKRARIEILEMLIEYELSLGYKDFDADFVAECVELCLALKGIKIVPEEIEKGKNELLKIMREKSEEVKNGSNENT
jgi:hypothetical protein